MGLIVRIDVDRAFGRQPIWRHVLSRIASDLYFPPIAGAGYLRELATILSVLNRYKARSHVFFRQCTLPSPPILSLLKLGRHHIGLHLEDSRSYGSFCAERTRLEQHLGYSVTAFSKHGSCGAKFGRRHHSPYEPDKYVEWARRANMSLFFGNLEDPTLAPMIDDSLTVFPSAFWLEPSWRDTRKFPIEWLAKESRQRHVVMLIHPENVLASPNLYGQLTRLVSNIPTAILEPAAA